MQNRLEAIQFKRKCAVYHYNQAQAAANEFALEQVYVFISEFTAMMEQLHASLLLARSCLSSRSAVDFKAYMSEMDEQTKEQWQYIEQFVAANRLDHLFQLQEEPELRITVKALIKANKHDYYEERDGLKYISEVMPFADQILQELLDLLSQDAAGYDQSWRTVDIFRGSFACSKCGAKATKLVKHLGDLREIRLGAKASLLPRFSYVYGHELHRAGLLPFHGANEVTEDELILHLDSLDFTTSRQPAPGCCGPDGSSFNVFCLNGHPIGKEASDCWMPRFIRIPQAAVKKYDVLS